MITSHETDHGAGHRGQEAFAYPLEMWADWVQKFVEPGPALHTKTHRAEEVVEHYFHVLERMLAIQREVAKCVVASYSWTATRAASMMHDAAKDARDVAREVSPKRDVHDGVRETAPKS